MLDQTGNTDKEYGAVLRVARNLQRYGQFDRALSLLDLADWLSPDGLEAGQMRVDLLMALDRFEDALTEVFSRTGPEAIAPATLARLYWQVGERDLGDETFRKSGSVPSD